MIKSSNSAKKSRKLSQQNSTKEPKPIDLEAEYEKYINYLLGSYGKEEYPDPTTYRHHKRTIKCMANKCKPDIINYLEADIQAARYRRTCKSPFDESCIKTIKNRFNPRDKFAKLTSCKTNKCITKKQMLDARMAYLDQEPTQQCMSKNCDKAISDFRANKILAKDECGELFNSKLLFLTTKKQPTSKENIPENRKDLRKFFKINKRFTYTDTKTNIKFIVNVCKCSKYESYDATDSDLYYNLNSAKIIKSSHRYDFYIDITNASQDIILQSIIKMEQALYLIPLVISKKQQNDIIKKYSDLVSKDIYKYNRYNKNPPLLTPKPVTLEKKYIIEPDDYTNISILTEYTVTEKADGERLLMFIDNVGKVYLINNTYMVIDTGLEASKELYNSLIDGEYISCVNRLDNPSIGLFAAFDMYYYGGEKITNLQLIDNDVKENSRYKYLKNTEKYIKQKSSSNSIDYFVKEHRYTDNILGDCDDILNNDKK